MVSSVLSMACCTLSRRLMLLGPRTDCLLRKRPELGRHHSGASSVARDGLRLPTHLLRQSKYDREAMCLYPKQQQHPQVKCVGPRLSPRQTEDEPRVGRRLDKRYIHTGTDPLRFRWHLPRLHNSDQWCFLQSQFVLQLWQFGHRSLGCKG